MCSVADNITRIDERRSVNGKDAADAHKPTPADGATLLLVVYQRFMLRDRVTRFHDSVAQ